MSSQAHTPPITGTHRAAVPHPRSEIDLLTLTITAIASAAAAFICSRVWAAGTLASAAFTPVLVALVKEALRRPLVHNWRLAAATGLAGFALFAFLATTTELLSGTTVTGRDGATTLFGGTRTVVLDRRSTTTVESVTPQVTTVIQQAPVKTTTVTSQAPAQAVPTTPTQPAPTPAPAATTETPAPAAP